MPFDQMIPRALNVNGVSRFVPPQSGVYGMSNGREWIYIGETDNLQQALLQHLQDSSTTMMQRKPTGFVFEVCVKEYRMGRQDRLVREYEPVCNRGPAGVR
jgi:excinuclease UvrABC nuclease subunit